jgi:hypothetical protein
MPPQVLPATPPEFHPEFGYIWPAAHTRRLVRVGLMSTAFGLLFGAIAVLAMTSRADPDGGRAATALSAVAVEEPATVGATTSAAPVAPVETATPILAAKQPTAVTCKEQTWPYLEGKCLSNTTRKRQPVRVLKPETPAQSGPAQVVPAWEPEITAAGKTQEPSKATKKREKTAKTRQRERDREFRDRERGRYADPRSAYASPYGSRYEMAPRGWGW